VGVKFREMMIIAAKAINEELTEKRIISEIKQEGERFYISETKYVKLQ
jgi:hypothetical protein